MIIASLLLILVAVTLLVLGLAGGSSTLLISSIVASLLAAVALVVGARQAGAGRRATGDPLAAGTPPTPAGSSVPGSAAYDDPAAYAGAPLRAGSAGGDPLPHPESPADAGSGRRGGAPDGAYNDGSAESGHVRREGEPDPERVIREAFSSREADRKAQAAGSPYDDEAPSAPTGAGHSDSEPDRAAAYAAGQRDAVTGLTGPSRTAAGPGPDVTQRVDTDTDAYAGPGDSDAGVDRVPYSGTDADSTAAGGRRPRSAPPTPTTTRPRR
ncbi:hypothetical protein Asp14428_25190 [Actinoplanes sp. NBRC 14428]|nr:hypothetical protein Asp14428_25190 [Actinoplanes sp. NBRC 14428]